MKKSSISRRNFLSKAATVGVAGVVAPTIITSCTRERKKVVADPVFRDQAPDGPVLKAGIIGCGGRGTGAASNFLDAGPNLKIVALGDVFQDRVDACRANILEQRGQEVPLENCFVGFDNWLKVLNTDVDVVILTTPPYFHPEHLAAAIDARKHVFMEKPACVDPVGARSVMASAQKAKGLGLCIGVGTQRHHQRDYVTTWHQVAQGAIGEITGGNVWWNTGKVWHRDPTPEWGEMEYMLRDWNNWTWLAGDHIVEQHCHNIDVMTWFTGSHPVSAVGMGYRLRRPTGDMYDFFDVDFKYEDGRHFHSQCRQIDGCANNVSERMVGTKGSTNCQNLILNHSGNEIWSYPYPLDEDGQPTRRLAVPAMIQEHIDLVTAIRTGAEYNEAESIAISTLVAIMGRESAYSGKEVTWEEMMNSDLSIGPTRPLDFSKVGYVKSKTVPIAGIAYDPEEEKRQAAERAARQKAAASAN